MDDDTHKRLKSIQVGIREIWGLDMHMQQIIACLIPDRDEAIAKISETLSKKTRTLERNDIKNDIKSDIKSDIKNGMHVIES